MARRGGKAGGRRGRAGGQGAMGLKCSSRAKGRGELPAELPQSVFKIRETELPLKVPSEILHLKPRGKEAAPSEPY